MIRQSESTSSSNATHQTLNSKESKPVHVRFLTSNWSTNERSVEKKWRQFADCYLRLVHHDATVVEDWQDNDIARETCLLTINQLIIQSSKQLISQSINWSIHYLIDQWIKQATDQSINLLINESSKQLINQLIYWSMNQASNWSIN